MQLKDRSLAGRVIVVTGATSGIGRAVSAAFASEAKALVGFGRSATDPAAIACPTAAETIMAIPGSIADAADVERLVGQTIARFARIDVLVNCAGIFPKGRFLEVAPEAWQEAVEVNLVGFARICRAVLPHMIAAGYGRIVNMSTRLAADPGRNMSAYAAAKAGAAVLTRCIASEIDPSRYPDILINDLIPGPTRTGMNEDGQEPGDVVPFVRDLVTLPSGGPTGKSFFKGEAFDPRGSAGGGRQGLFGAIFGRKS
jgi:NAD(P)-dependent dehydrogenase (short-subunit alcohol dehydrogenase family)